MLQRAVTLALLGADASHRGVTEPDWKQIGRELAAARGDRTQGEIERVSGVDRQTISNYENGKVARPTVATLTKIANAVGYRLPAMSSETELERDAVEMPSVTAYFKKHPERERFRGRVNAYLHSSTGDIPMRVVVSVVRALEDEEIDE
jgi:transcriptional regulator with XRE-family HTH domain